MEAIGKYQDNMAYKHLWGHLVLYDIVFLAFGLRSTKNFLQKPSTLSHTTTTRSSFQPLSRTIYSTAIAPALSAAALSTIAIFAAIFSVAGISAAAAAAGLV